MIEEKLFKYLKINKNFNDFYSLYLEINPSYHFNYDILFRDWTENEYDSKEYIRWHKYLVEIIGQEGYEILLEQL